MMTRNPYHYENDESSHNTNTTNDNRVRKHRSLINLKSPFPSSIPRRSNSIDRNKPSKNVSSIFDTKLSIKNEKNKEKEMKQHSFIYVPISSSNNLKTKSSGKKLINNNNNNNNNNNDNTPCSTYYHGKENKKNNLKEEEIASKYSLESINHLLLENSKNVKSLDDKRATYLLSKYTNSLLKKSLETSSNEIEPKALSLSPSTSQPPTIDLDFNKKENSSISRKSYEFTAGGLGINNTDINNDININTNINDDTDGINTNFNVNSNRNYSCNMNEAKPSLNNQFSYDTLADSKSYSVTASASKSHNKQMNSLSNHHSTSRFKYPMSFNKRKSTVSGFTHSNKEYDDFEELSFNIYDDHNNDNDNELEPLQDQFSKELEESTEFFDFSSSLQDGNFQVLSSPLLSSTKKNTTITTTTTATTTTNDILDATKLRSTHSNSTLINKSLEYPYQHHRQSSSLSSQDQSQTRAKSKAKTFSNSNIIHNSFNSNTDADITNNSRDGTNRDIKIKEGDLLLGLSSTTISSSSSSSSSHSSSTQPHSLSQNVKKKSNNDILMEPISKISSSSSSSSSPLLSSSSSPTPFKSSKEEIKSNDNSIDDKTILNTFTVAFDNISSLSTKIDLLTEIMDKNEEKQQQQYNSDMNQINFELFDIKQKVGQSMKRLQQEIDPILQSLREKTEMDKQKKREEQKNESENENENEKIEDKEIKEKVNIKTLSSPSTSTSSLSTKEKTELLFEQEAIKAKNERLEQDFVILKSQFINLSNENQILRKRLDIISKRLPYFVFFHILTFGFLAFFSIHGLPSNKKEDIYELSLQGRNYIQFYWHTFIKFIYRLWYQVMSFLNHQNYY